MLNAHVADTATNPAVVQTDAGTGYLKAIENDSGSDALAREFVATSLAELVGLSTFKYCLFDFDGKLEVILSNGAKVEKGMEFMTKEEQGINGKAAMSMLNHLVNKDHIARLICFDTFVRNVDRCYIYNGKRHVNWDNVFLAHAPRGRFLLKAMDFSHAFWGNLDNAMDKADNVNDEEIYGLFPEFSRFLKKSIVVEVCKALTKIQNNDVHAIIDSIPVDWNIGQDTREAWIRFIIGRADFVANNFLRLSGLDTSRLIFKET